MKKLILIVAILISGCNPEEQEMSLLTIITSSSQTTETVFSLPVDGILTNPFVGQSNCRGSALDSNASAGELDATNTLLMWNDTTIYENLDVGTNNNSNTGTHGRELGLSLLHNSTDPLYMLKYGSSGTDMLAHLPGGSEYDVYYTQIKAGINNLINAGKRPFVFLTFHQGEADGDAIDAPLYADRLDTWVTQWRANLGANLPIIVTEIKESLATSYMVNDAFAAKAASDPLFWVISAKDLASIDGVHFTYASQKTIAQRQFDLMSVITPIEITTLIP